MSQTTDRALVVIEGVLGLAQGSLSPTMTKEDVPQWDSLRHMQVVVALEDEFDISFTDEELVSGWPSVGACLASVESHVGGS